MLTHVSITTVFGRQFLIPRLRRFNTNRPHNPGRYRRVNISHLWRFGTGFSHLDRYGSSSVIELLAQSATLPTIWLLCSFEIQQRLINFLLLGG